MELWQGLPPEIRRDYAVVHTVKCTAEKELVLLQRRADGLRVLLRNYPREAPAVYALLAGRELPHMPRILACEAREGGGYVLEEFIEGRRLGDGPLLEPQHALRVLRQTCEALAALHALGVVHRDVKPENLLETPDGQVYLLDFDAARQYKSHVEKDTCTLGTTGYAAPEQFGIVQTDQRADIFALGVTLNVLATGCHPSQKLCRAPLRHIVLKCTRIDPRARYQTAQAVRRACAPRLLWLRCTAGPARVRSVRMAALCACAVFLCAACTLLLRSFLQPDALPVAPQSSAVPYSDSSTAPVSLSLSGTGSMSGSLSTSASASGSMSTSSVFSFSETSDASRGTSSSRPSSSSQQSASKPASSNTTSNTSPSAASSNTGSRPASSSKPASSSSSSKPASSSSKPASSSEPASSSSKPASSSSKPTSSSAPPASSNNPQHEAEIRAAIAEYEALYNQYLELSQLHQAAYQEYQALYGYQLEQYSATSNAASSQYYKLRDAAAAAQARADAALAADPPDTATAQAAQAEADSLSQQAAEQWAIYNEAHTAWQTLSNQPEVQAARSKFSNYAVQTNALSPQCSALRDRVYYLQDLYGIYLM